jgi:glycosyltransferase involved in cell wall biosynthesis
MGLVDGKTLLVTGGAGGSGAEIGRFPAMDPVVSVLMPVYQVERWVADAVESILAQTLRELELLVVDDGSRDATGAICARIAARDPRVVLLREPHAGIVAALNRGLALARGRYLARMDGDDVALPGRLEAQLRHLEAHPEVVALGSAIELIDPEGVPLATVVRPTTHEEIERELLRGHGSITHPSVVMRTHAVRAVGGYRPEFEYVEDQDLFLRLSERGRLANLEAPLLRQRQHMGSVCKTRQPEQRIRLRRLVEDTHARRGLALPEDIDARIALPQRLAAWDQRRVWLRRALKAGRGPAAVKHAWLLLRERPAARRSWRLALRVLRRPHFLWQAWRARGRG